MADKRLDFEAPLLSVRRFSAAATATASSSSLEKGKDEGLMNRRRSSLPFYKSDLKSGPVRNPGVVPFVWEQRPGQPKGNPDSNSSPSRPPMAPKLPPCVGNSVRTRRTIRSSPTVEAKPPVENPLPPPEEPVRREDKVFEEMVEMQQEERNVAYSNIGDDEKEEDKNEEEEEDNFSDALDTLSRTESFFMNCSVSGMSGLPDSANTSGGFSNDPQVKDFMMGRFLPAAQAVAIGSPQYTFRKGRQAKKPVETIMAGEHRRPVQLPRQHTPNYVSQYAKGVEGGVSYEEDEEEDEDYDDKRYLPSKGCGLLPKFCLKSSFCLLNPVPGVKVRGRLPPPRGRRSGSPLIRSSVNATLGQVEDEHSWDAVYKHKMGQRYQPQVEDGSKLTSESNQLNYWSDSQTADGSSPFHRSTGEGISPYRDEAPASPVRNEKSSLGVPIREGRSSRTDQSDSCEKDSEHYWEATTPHSSRQGSGSMSPAGEKTLYVDSVNMQDTRDSESSYLDVVTEISTEVNSGENDFELGERSQRMEEGCIVEARESDELQRKVAEIVVPHLSNCLERPKDGEMDGNKISKQDIKNDGLMHLEGDHVKKDVTRLPSTIPLQLPKSPSDSWLSRTLPTVSSKKPSSQSFLGIQFQPKKQALHASTDPKLETSSKLSKPQHRQIRFAEVLSKPASLKSEI
ncbi:uncharacterized protein [Typha latifolia]|uniref:uncharacterized protein n=1 Tax=Typha latifolia TaxID=4733 RepID=UPI003C2B408C